MTKLDMCISCITAIIYLLLLDGSYLLTVTLSTASLELAVIFSAHIYKQKFANGNTIA